MIKLQIFIMPPTADCEIHLYDPKSHRKVAWDMRAVISVLQEWKDWL